MCGERSGYTAGSSRCFYQGGADRDGECCGWRWAETEDLLNAKVLLETERLVLRRLVSADAELLFELDSDPEVRRYVHAGSPDLSRIRDEVLPRMTAYYDHHDDLGFWAAEEKSTEAFVGWFCLRPEAGTAGGGDPELGFRLRRQVWGRGLATEAARGLVEKAFAEPGASRVVAVTLVENRAAQRVLEKVGFDRTGEFLYEPPPHAEAAHNEQNRRAYRYVLARERLRPLSTTPRPQTRRPIPRL